MKDNVMIYYMDMRDPTFKKTVSTDNGDQAHTWKRFKKYGKIDVYEAPPTKRNIDAMSGALEFMKVVSLHHHVVWENVTTLETQYSKRNR